MTHSLISANAAATHALGAALGVLLLPDDVVLLHGDLGSGKTTLVQGIVVGLGITEVVASPTFTLVNEYCGIDGSGRPFTVAHLDLYRLRDDGDLDTIGLDDYLAPIDTISLIEWPERASERLGDSGLLIQLDHTGTDSRRITLSTLGEHRIDLWLPRFVKDSGSQIPGIGAVPTVDTPDRASSGGPPTA